MLCVCVRIDQNKLKLQINYMVAEKHFTVNWFLPLAQQKGKTKVHIQVFVEQF